MPKFVARRVLLMASPINRMAISATARLNKKKLVDVLIETFLGQGKSHIKDRFSKTRIDNLRMTWQTRILPQVPVAPIIK